MRQAARTNTRINSAPSHKTQVKGPACGNVGFALTRTDMAGNAAAECQQEDTDILELAPQGMPSCGPGPLFHLQHQAREREWAGRSTF